MLHTDSSHGGHGSNLNIFYDSVTRVQQRETRASGAERHRGLNQLPDFSIYNGQSLYDVVKHVAPMAREEEEYSFVMDMEGLESLISRLQQKSPRSTDLVEFAGRLLDHELRDEALYFYRKAYETYHPSEGPEFVQHDSLLQIAKVLKSGNLKMDATLRMKSLEWADIILNYLASCGSDEATSFL